MFFIDIFVNKPQRDQSYIGHVNISDGKTRNKT